MKLEIVNPESLGIPKGWNHGVLAPAGGRILFVAGQSGWQGEAVTAPDATGTPSATASGAAEPPGFVEQFAHALDNILAVVREAGGEPTDVARLTIYVTDLAAYRRSLKPLGEAWRARFGKYYPAIALLEVKGLADRGAMVEIEATAVVGGR